MRRAPAHHDRRSCPHPNEQAPGAHIQSVSLNAARVGSQIPTYHHDYCQRALQAYYLLTYYSRPLTATVAPGKRHGCHSTSQSTSTSEVTSRAHIARACLGLVTKRCLEVPPECMQGGSLWPGRALERQRMTRAAPRWLELTRLSDQHST